MTTTCHGRGRNSSTSRKPNCGRLSPRMPAALFEWKLRAWSPSRLWRVCPEQTPAHAEARPFVLDEVVAVSCRTMARGWFLRRNASPKNVGGALPLLRGDLVSRGRADRAAAIQTRKSYWAGAAE